MTPRAAARAATIIRLDPNVPTELALQHPNGMNVQGGLLERF